jgi:hypothetical protein
MKFYLFQFPGEIAGFQSTLYRSRVVTGRNELHVLSQDVQVGQDGAIRAVVAVE